MIRALALVTTVVMLAPVPSRAQSVVPPGLGGVWAPYHGGRGDDPALAPPPPTPLVLKPEYAKPFEARKAAEAAAAAKGEPLASDAVACVPYGVPRMMSVALYPIEILPTPGQVTIVTEAFSEVRRIYLGKPQLAMGDVPPGYYGHSVGHVEGDTLLVDTIGIKSAVPAYQNMPHSERMRITERLRLVAPDYLHDQVTIDDPVVLDKPVTYTLAYKRLPGYEMVEFVCDNNREFIDANGGTHLKLGDR